MTKIARIIWVDALVWNRFQVLHPRKASQVVNESLKRMIDFEDGIIDEDLTELRNEEQILIEKLNEMQELCRQTTAKRMALESKLKEEQLEKEANVKKEAKKIVDEVKQNKQQIRELMGLD